MMLQKKINFVLVALLIVGSQLQAIDGNVQMNSTNKTSWAKQKVHTIREKAYDAYAYTCEKTRALYEKAKEHKKFIAGIVTGIVVGYLGTESILALRGNPTLFNRIFRMPGDLAAANAETALAQQQGRDQVQQQVQLHQHHVRDLRQQFEQDQQNIQNEIIRLNQQVQELNQELSERNELCDINDYLYQEEQRNKNALQQERQELQQQIEQLHQQLNQARQELAEANAYRLVNIGKVQNDSHFEPIANELALETINVDTLNDVKYVLLNEQIVHDIVKNQNFRNLDKKYDDYSKMVSDLLMQDSSIPKVVTQEMLYNLMGLVETYINNYPKKNVLSLEYVQDASDDKLRDRAESVSSSEEEDSGSWEVDLSSDDNEGCTIF